ncbi:23S rRNA (cytidine2498-2'-O)-methyltransferase [Paenibacillus phyllosphaerae]|uniref:23S rRNA (Cytidine2498-2'-O)-methyltransferase n=1 Tax=Paenibacillus phyllosphaerae TaxID=274593 RepID=A0A7W5AXL8_9BACL|nr:SAM-dependent methyltransferase [Paenibacillus phyllosphaerae]MBB3110349.1 23S rRNA (cytidine2498-2'-O)-methyltransferase [Paenibacillus phyllosphaerae]
MTQWICTANRGFATYAMEELRRQFEGIKISQLTHGEVFIMESPLTREAVLDQIRTNEPIFLRHIHPVDKKLPIQGSADDLQALSELARHARLRIEDKQVAVHLRRAERSPYPYSTADTKAVLDAVLEEVGAEPVLQSPDVILSIFAGLEELYVGIATPEEQLSDWPGGAVRFQREEGQISRAKFKLLEAERAFHIRLEEFREGLDIGAAPGGWTHLLLERGLKVTAVDPAELHPSLFQYPRLTNLRKNASDLKFQPGTFDLLVCDMSWSPMQMVRLVLDLEEALQPGATAIITVKLMHKKPLQTIKDVISRFGTVFVLRKAKQLFHNREEITLYLVKK